jgi:hypothetical protein
MGQWLSSLDLAQVVSEGKPIKSDEGKLIYIPNLYNVDLSDVKQMKRSETEFNVYVVYPAKFDYLVKKQIVAGITNKLAATLHIVPNVVFETFENPAYIPLQKAYHFVLLFHPFSAWAEWNGQILNRLRTALYEGRLQCDSARLVLYESYLSFV